jgi:hypothetical protein
MAAAAVDMVEAVAAASAAAAPVAVAAEAAAGIWTTIFRSEEHTQRSSARETPRAKAAPHIPSLKIEGGDVWGLMQPERAQIQRRIDTQYPKRTHTRHGCIRRRRMI